MSGPKDGKYYISPAGKPKLVVGVDGVGEPSVPVVVDGKYNIFTVKKLENGNYTLVIEEHGEIPVFIQHEGGNLVGDLRPLPTNEWVIRGSDCGPYGIEVPGPIWPTLNWFLNSEEPQSPVLLTRNDFPQPWNFVPLPKPL